MKVWTGARFFWCDEACDYKWEGLRLRTGDASVLCCCVVTLTRSTDAPPTLRRLRRGKGRRRSERIRVGLVIWKRLRCTAASMMMTHDDGASEARLVSARSDDDRSFANQHHRLVAFPKKNCSVSAALHCYAFFIGCRKTSRRKTGYVFHGDD